MTKLRIALIGAVLCGLVAAPAAEAYRTSAKEGRKHSRLYMEDYYPSYKQRECWRIGPKGAGRRGFRVARNGVVCRFSSPKRGREGGACNTFGIAVKDNRPDGRLVIQGIVQTSVERRVDGEWCDGEPGAPAPPKPEGAKKLLFPDQLIARSSTGWVGLD